MIVRRPTPVTAFIDWNSQIHVANSGPGAARDVAERTLLLLGRAIGRMLSSLDRAARFDVAMRVYHGWHKGFEPTENRRAFATAAAGVDFSALSTKANVIIRPEFSYGDRLLSALDRRLHARMGIHLPNTLHRPSRTRGADFEENMVDTAIAADVVHLAHVEPERWIVVIGEDDDLIPPVFTAEAIRGAGAGRVLVMRRRAAGPFLKLDGILEAQ